jgi:type I restriction enzyme S subunit
MSFPRYPRHKDSGVEWLGSVPEHWDVVRAAHLFREVAEPGAQDLPILSVSIHDGVSDEELSPEELDRKVTRSDDRSKYKKVAPGDLVYNMMRAWQGGFGTVRVTGMVSPAYVVARPKSRFSTTFVEYLLRTPQAIEEMRRRSHGVTDFRLRLYWDQFKDLCLTLPPVEEQNAIISFLEGETAKIDALVEEQKRLIDLLKEKRQAAISYAVTKGLNANAPMRTSGIEWLGEVPEHWTVKRLKYLGDAIIGLTYSPDEITDEGDGVLVLRSSNVSNDRIVLEDNVFVRASIPDELKARRGDILICSRNGSRALIGKNAVIEEEHESMTFGAFMTVFRSIFSPFLRWVFRSQLFEAQAGAFMSSTINQLTSSTLCSMEIALPPECEQLEIARYLERTVSQIDDLINEAVRAVELLAERRAAVICSAVTGEIDVRRRLVEADVLVSEVVAA